MEEKCTICGNAVTPDAEPQPLANNDKFCKDCLNMYFGEIQNMGKGEDDE